MEQELEQQEQTEPYKQGKVNQEVRRDLYMPPIVAKELEKVRHRVLNKDRDWVIVIDGEEGVGKSVLAQQIGAFLDPSFCLDNIVFNSDQFLKKIKDKATKKGTCIVLDEAFSAANNRASLSDVNKAMIGVATEMRQKNLFIIMVLPSFFDLDRYFALWRCKALFHVYFTPNEDRNYVIFPKDHKKELYLTGKKRYSYAKPHSPLPAFHFPNRYMVDEMEYRKKKEEAFSKRVVSFRAQQWLAQRNAYIKFILQNMGLNQSVVAKIPVQYGAGEITQQNISHLIKELAEISENSG